MFYRVIIKQCLECGKRLDALRLSRLTCSDACRTKRARRIRALTPPWPTGRFDLAMVDIPLRWTGYSAKGEGRSPQAHYPTMDVPALLNLLPPMFDTIMAPRSTVCWWVYGPRLPESLVVMSASFEYRGELLAWRKPGNFGTGLTTRKRYEGMWYGARRGRGLPFRCHPDQEIAAEEDLPLLIEAPRLRPHSRKPDLAYTTLEQLFGEVRQPQRYRDVRARPRRLVEQRATDERRRREREERQHGNHEPGDDPQDVGASPADPARPAVAGQQADRQQQHGGQRRPVLDRPGEPDRHPRP